MIDVIAYPELRKNEVQAQYLEPGTVISLPSAWGGMHFYADGKYTVRNVYTDERPGVEKGYVWLELAIGKCEISPNGETVVNSPLENETLVFVHEYLGVAV